MKNRYHYETVVENARIKFSISPYCTVLFSRKENFKFFEVALPAALSNCAFGCIMSEVKGNIGIYKKLQAYHNKIDNSLKHVFGNK